LLESLYLSSSQDIPTNLVQQSDGTGSSQVLTDFKNRLDSTKVILYTYLF